MVYGRYIELVNGLINQQTSLGGTTLYLLISSQLTSWGPHPVPKARCIRSARPLHAVSARCSCYLRSACWRPISRDVKLGPPAKVDMEIVCIYDIYIYTHNIYIYIIYICIHKYIIYTYKIYIDNIYTYNIYIYIHNIYIWVNYIISLTWIKAHLGLVSLMNYDSSEVAVRSL